MCRRPNLAGGDNLLTLAVVAVDLSECAIE